MSRTERLTLYVSESDRNRLEREADDQDMSLSGYAMSLIERQWESDDVEAAADQLDAEEKVEAIVADARDDLTEIAEDAKKRNEALADMVARSGTYSIANFELLKDAHDPAEARKAETLQMGSRRLREPLADHPALDLDTEADEESEDGDGEERNLVEELRDTPEQKERKKRQKVRRDHAQARRELRKRKRREEQERNSGLSGIFR